MGNKSQEEYKKEFMITKSDVESAHPGGEKVPKGWTVRPLTSHVI